jgi:deoxyribose-phosphate aldolase
VQELNDQLFKKHDTITELELIINKEHSKFEELKKIQAELSKTHQNLQEIHKKVLLETTELKSTLNQQES